MKEHILDMFNHCLEHPVITAAVVIGTVLWMLAYYPEDDWDDEEES